MHNRKNITEYADRRFAGFTMMELLVVMAIIFLLVGLLVPGTRVVTRLAKDLRQKSKFHAMEVGLEFFYNDFENYPDSTCLTGGGKFVCGAQHLVEALAGRNDECEIDGKAVVGFDPETTWNAAQEQADGVTDIYPNDAKGSSLDEKEDYELRRKLPYIERDDFDIITIGRLYDDTGDVFASSGAYKAPVFGDVYERKNVTLANGETIKAGSPVLYFKANTQSRLFGTDTGGADWSKWIYNYLDNMKILALGHIRDQNKAHPWYHETDPTVRDGFYDDITNPKVEAYEKPYNSTSYLLVAPGWDGLYGTKDDVTNFDR